MDGMLERYLMELLGKQQYKLIPFYTCRLKAETRQRVCRALLMQLTRQGSDETRQETLEDLDLWFGLWRDQELGDVQPHELESILESVSPAYPQT